MRHSFDKGFDLRTFARALTIAASLFASYATASAQHEGHDMNKHMPQPTPTPARPSLKETPTPTPSPTPTPAPAQEETHDAHAGHAGGATGGADHSSHGKEMTGMNHASGGDAGGLMVMSGDGMGVRVGGSAGNVTPMGQMGSGTAWQPTSTPTYMWHSSQGEWLLMLHGEAKLGVNRQGGPRGVTKFES